jgi:hypothetical protein
VSFWVKNNAIGSGENSVVLERDDENVDWGVSFELNNATPQYMVSINGFGDVLTPASSPVTTGVWYFFAGTFDGSQEKIYINGVVAGTPQNIAGTISARYTLGSTLTDRFLNGTLDDVRIYNRAWSFGANPVRFAISTDSFWDKFNGTIDDVRIYNRALSATEVQQLYKLGTFKITSH